MARRAECRAARYLGGDFEGGQVDLEGDGGDGVVLVACCEGLGRGRGDEEGGEGGIGWGSEGDEGDDICETVRRHVHEYFGSRIVHNMVEQTQPR